MRLVRAIHDLALALLAGGIACVFLSVTVLFARAPSREVAGDIGTAIFGRLGWVVLILAAIALAARLVLRTAQPASTAREAGMYASGAALIVAALNALWLTPRMTALWAAGARAGDGSGLMGDDRGRFLMLHGVSNVAYLAILVACLLLIVLRPESSRADRP